MYTVITKGNNVSKHTSPAKLGLIDHIIVITDSGEIIVNQGNPITWPTDATNGMQAIVDVKAGTLRFGYDWWPRAQTEFVVSEYVAPVKKGLHSETIVVEWPEDAPDGLRLIHNLNTLTSKFESPRYVLKQDEVVGAVKGMCSVPPVTQPGQVTAASILTAALGHMEDRAKTYDAPGGERSMGKTVAAFNVITGQKLTEEAGWLFMEILKQVRSQQGDYRADNYEDMVAYAALRGECAARERGLL